MIEIFSYVIILGIFLAVFIPLVAGIIHYVKENKRLDKEREAKLKSSANNLSTH